MNFKKNIAIVTVGHVKFALEDNQSALELMAILSKAVQLNDYLYPVREYTTAEFCLADEVNNPELKFVRSDKIDGQRTRDEIKKQGEREKKDREDLETQIREMTEKPALPAPSEEEFL